MIRSRSGEIDYWISEKDGGIYNAMNKGVAQAQGEYCLFLNSGDTLNDSDVVRDVLPHLDDLKWYLNSTCVIPYTVYND